MMSEDDAALSGDSTLETDDTMERAVSNGDRLPLHPTLAENVDDDADNTETSSVRAESVMNAANSTSDDVNSTSKSGSKPVAPLFPMPDLREREDGGAISFDDEDDEEPVEDTVDPVSDEVRSKSRAEFTTVYDVIDTMEENLSEAKNVLFAAGMVKIDRDAFADHLSRLKDMLPVQLERASALMREAERRLRTAQAQANSIVTSAQSKAAQIVEEAQERAQFLAGQENVTALAKKKAREIVADAQAKSDKLTQGADKYCTNVMDGLKQQLDKLEQDVQAGQRVLEERRLHAEREQRNLSASLHDDDEMYYDEDQKIFNRIKIS